MVGILELPDREIRTTINMLRALMDNIETMQELMGNVRIEIEILRKNQMCFR